MAQQVTVDIDAEGNVKVAVAGIRGAGCHALTRAIEAAIGTTSGDQKTAEFHQGASCSVPQQARAGQ